MDAFLLGFIPLFVAIDVFGVLVWALFLAGIAVMMIRSGIQSMLGM